MAVGLPSKIIEPAAAGSPHWLQQLINWAGTAWSYHPVQAGASAVWIQVGIGLWLLFAPRGALSRLAGLAAAAWGLVVWVFGESLGAILAPGLSWLNGAPGAAALYAVGGRADRAARAGAGAARPWPGCCAGGTGGVPGRDGAAAGLAGPRVLVGHGSRPGRPGGLDGQRHGQHPAARGPGPPGVGLRCVRRRPRLRGQPGRCAGPGRQPGSGAGRPGRPRQARGGSRRRARGQRLRPRARLPLLAVFCLAVWVLVQDFGFFGGLGTDPNSMIPVILLASAAYHMPWCRRPAAAAGDVDGDARRPRPRRLTRASRSGPPRRPAPSRPPRASGHMLSAYAIGVIIPRRAAHGRGPGQPERVADPGRGRGRVERAAAHHRARLRADRPARPPRVAGQPARQGRAAHLPGPGVHRPTARSRPRSSARPGCCSAPSPARSSWSR